MSPILWLSNGVTVSNLIIGTESSSGIWCSGSCTLKNVYFERVCTHAAAFNATTDFTKTDRRSFTYTVEGGAGLHALDKMFVQSGPGKTIINNFCGDGFQKVWRSCGTCNDEPGMPRIKTKFPSIMSKYLVTKIVQQELFMPVEKLNQK
uniref:Probable pectate lyase F n=1 Tax=Meloidogyne javanica TaxID=6303 RepID=A0A915LLK7_MELJA